jgi:hypothetical protein
MGSHAAVTVPVTSKRKRSQVEEIIHNNNKRVTQDFQKIGLLTDKKKETTGDGRQRGTWDMEFQGGIDIKSVTENKKRELAKDGWRAFEDAMLFARTQDIKSYHDWKIFCKSGERPVDIPSDPCRVYAMQGWVGWGYWLGTGKMAGNVKIWRPFDEAIQFVQTLKLSSYREWRAWCCLAGARPQDIPSAPERTYKDKGWKGWKHWLGNDRVDQPLDISDKEEEEKGLFHLNYGFPGDRYYRGVKDASTGYSNGSDTDSE